MANEANSRPKAREGAGRRRARYISDIRAALAPPPPTAASGLSGVRSEKKAQHAVLLRQRDLQSPSPFFCLAFFVIELGFFRATTRNNSEGSASPVQG
jgi:hypothetical protein